MYSDVRKCLSLYVSFVYAHEQRRSSLDLIRKAHTGQTWNMQVQPKYIARQVMSDQLR